MSRAGKKAKAPRAAGVAVGAAGAGEGEVMWVRFLRNCDFTPPEDRKVTWARKVGEERPMRRAHAEELIARGDAEPIETPTRPDPEQ